MGLTTKPRVRRRIGEWLRSERGNIALLFAVTLPLVIGGGGFGVETTYWYLQRLEMQRAADAAAHAGAMEARTGGEASAIEAIAIETAGANGFNLATGVAAVHSPPLTGTGGNTAVEVILTMTAERFFTAVFNPAGIPLTARAVARYNNAADACVLALNKTASKSALFSGSSDLKLNGCSVMANSVANDAITAQGSAKVKADCFISAGGISLTAGATYTCPSTIPNAMPVADPFKNLPVPTPSGACLNDNGANLSPGRYCSGMFLKNNVTLQPGVYYISGGSFQMNANANVTCAGCTFYLDAGARVAFNGNATINLSAPTTGTYKGVLFFGSRSGTGSNTFNGSAASKMTGALYFATQDVQYNGNFSGTNGCTQVVADTVTWTGNTTINADCSSLGMGTIPAMLIVKLTE